MLLLGLTIKTCPEDCFSWCAAMWQHCVPVAGMQCWAAGSLAVLVVSFVSLKVLTALLSLFKS
jgi:hypothetical protein